MRHTTLQHSTLLAAVVAIPSTDWIVAIVAALIVALLYELIKRLLTKKGGEGPPAVGDNRKRGGRLWVDVHYESHVDPGDEDAPSPPRRRAPHDGQPMAPKVIGQKSQQGDSPEELQPAPKEPRG